MDIIFGIHSITAAVDNKARTGKKLYGTKDALAKFRSKRERMQCLERSTHQLQEEAKRLCRQEGFEFHRVPSQMFLTCDPLPAKDLSFAYQVAENSDGRLLLLDGVTDIHNLAAIVRTAAFYNFSAVLLSRKGELRFSPAFFRISSGAFECLAIVNTKTLSQAIEKLALRGMSMVGLSASASEVLRENCLPKGQSVGLVLGAEETGLSHSVRRVLPHCYALRGQGAIQDLNVSVAAAVSMERLFGNN